MMKINFYFLSSLLNWTWRFTLLMHNDSKTNWISMYGAQNRFSFICKKTFLHWKKKEKLRRCESIFCSMKIRFFRRCLSLDELFKTKLQTKRKENRRNVVCVFSTFLLYTRPRDFDKARSTMDFCGKRDILAFHQRNERSFRKISKKNKIFPKRKVESLRKTLRFVRRR